MDFAFTKDQELIRKSAREFFDKECPKDKVRELKESDMGYDPKMWKKMAELGFLGLMIPEEYGGTEGEFIDLMIFLEEIGRNIVPSPFFTSVVLCSLPILQFGSQKQKERFLPEIVERGKIWTFAQVEKMGDNSASDIKLKATLEGGEYVLNGMKRFVPYANVADMLMVAARTEEADKPEEGITLFYLDAKSDGITTELIPTAARDMRCEVKFNNVRVPAENILGPLNDGWNVIDRVLQYAAILKAAEMSGGALSALNLTIKYVKDRHQFNKPIGSLQAIQHKLVELTTDIEGLRFLVHQAAWKINIGEPSGKLISMAKIKANAVYHNMGYFGIFFHGAIGWTEEMDIGLYHVRTRANVVDGGDTDFHYNLLAHELKQQEPLFKEIYS